MDILTQIKEILPYEFDEIMTDGVYLNFKKIKNGYEFHYGSMYNRPPVSFAQLLKLSELFGTQKIDLDDYCNSIGCDSCGYGSDYGHTIQVYEPTKYVEFLEELCQHKNGKIY